MSLFLGPIHYWLYNKIKLQNDIIEDILNTLNIQNIIEMLNNNFGCLENKPLEEMIDTQNIHGWLQQKVDVVENRLAYTIKYALEQDESSLDKIKQIFFKFGTNVNIEDKDNAILVFKSIEDTILDGMPCDRAKKIIEKNENLVSFQRSICVHKKYWDNIGIDISIYYFLVDQFILGILSNTKFTLVKENNINTIKIL